MKRASLLVVVTALALALAPLGASAGTLSGAFDLHFDGYCDGLHLNFPSLGLGQMGTVDGDQTGCVTGGVFGSVRVPVKQTYLTVPGFSTFTVINQDHTWIHYGLNGNLIYVLNSGTWSPGPPTDTRAPSSFAHATPHAKPFVPATTTDINFDGYCDGMEFIAPSAGLGTPGTVDGNRTGCASDPLMGAHTHVNGTLAFVVTFNNGGSGMWIQTVVYADGTWVHYAANGDLIYVLNSGTWSMGTPGGGRSSTG
jgi:hypothetical protein